MRRAVQRVSLLVVVFLLLSAFYLRLAFCFSDKSIWPEASGTIVYTNGSLTVDASHSDDGYVMVKGEPSDKRYKMRISLGKNTMTYDVRSDGEYQVYPLQLGSGKYTVSLFKNASGKKYAEAGTVKAEFAVRNADVTFLGPNVYVDYYKDSPAVALSDEICAGLETDAQKFEAIRSFIVEHYTYDYAKAASIQDGTMPDMNHVLNDGMGVCQDLATLAGCMLRVQGVPTKFMIGYCGKTYHAWDYVTIDGKDVLYDPTADICGAPGTKYSVERYY